MPVPPTVRGASGAPGAVGGHHLGAVRGGQGHHHRRHAPRRHRRRPPLRHHLHHPRQALVRGGRGRLPLPDRSRSSRRCATGAGSWRRPRSTATGTARPATRSPRRSRRARTPSSRSTSRVPARSATRCPEALLIFVVPPSLDELRRRLVGRDTEPSEALERRWHNAAYELLRQAEYDHVVVNHTGQADGSAAEIEAIIAAEHAAHPDAAAPGLASLGVGHATSRRAGGRAELVDVAVDAPGVPGGVAVHLARATVARGPGGGRGGAGGVRPAPGGRGRARGSGTRPMARRGRPSRCWRASGPTGRC